MANKSSLSNLLLHRLNQTSLVFINEKVLDNLSLDKIKQVYSLAVKSNNKELQEKCISKARTKFPHNTFSYVEEAKNQLKHKKFNDALRVLNDAPHNKEVSELKKKVKTLKNGDGVSGPELSAIEFEKLENPTLAEIKTIYGLAIERNDIDLQVKCIETARVHFPQHTFSYIEEAKNLIEYEKFDDAWKVLNKSPNSRTVESLKERILSHDGTHKTVVLEEEMMKVSELIKLKPLNLKYYDEYIRFLGILNKNKEVTKLVKSLPFNIDSLSMKTRFAIVESYLSLGDQKNALDDLLVMQKKYAMDRRVFFKISDIYKFDKQTARAYTFLLLGESTYPVYGAIRRLTFESDHNMINQGIETFDRVLDFKDSELVRFMSMISRVSCFYPEKMNKFTEARAKVKEVVGKNILKNNDEFNKSLKTLLSNRWFVDAIEFKKKGLDHGFEVNESVLALYEKIEKNLIYSDSKSIIGWLDLADENEKPNILLGVLNGFPVDANKLQRETVKVELFIPNAFFTPPEDEKPTFKTAQEYFRNVCEIVQSFEDVVVIPRHQFNWKKVYRKTNFKAISYHTFNDVNNPNWLHVQESTLANHCSIDTKGFAGYSKIANDFSHIEECTKNIEDSVLDESFNYLHQEYVVNNVSKYHQKEKAFACEDEYVFVALQVLTDLVADIAFFDGIAMLKTIVQYYKNTATKVVVKRHPYCNSLSMQLLIEGLLNEGAIIVSDASIHSIIENAKAVFVVNSGVGFESLMHLKPVIVCGQCDYAYAVSNQVRNPQELLQYLEKDVFLVDEQRVKKLLYYYANIYNPKLDELPSLLKEWIYDE